MANNCWITLKITMNPDRVRLNKKIGTDGVIRCKRQMALNAHDRQATLSLLFAFYLTL